MAHTTPASMPKSAWVFPALALLFVGATWVAGVGGTFEASAKGLLFAGLLIPILLGTVFAAVHHAEVIALRTGEPYGTLILTVAVTVIEVALIASIMLTTDGGSQTIARDTVFAVVMIVGTGLVGLCIFVGGFHHHEQSFRVTGASAYLAVLLAMSIMTLVLPNYTSTVAGPVYAPSQLGFIAAVTIALYIVFLYMQTVRHREYFIMNAPRAEKITAHKPSSANVTISGVLLVVALSGVILLAKKFAAVAEAATTALGAPEAAVGVVVALLILLPEAVAAVQAARQNELQKSINLALGSSLATIGLTIPAVAVLSMVLGQTLILGLDGKDTVLLFLTLAVSVLTFATGRTNMLFGCVHLVIFATFLFLTLVP